MDYLKPIIICVKLFCFHFFLFITLPGTTVTYPTKREKENHLQKCSKVPLGGDILVPRRGYVTSPNHGSVINGSLQ